jgi:hypothetical protein
MQDRLSREEVLLWLGFFGVPAAWALHLVAAYLLVPVACQHDTRLPLLGVTALAVAIAAAAGLALYRVRGHRPTLRFVGLLVAGASAATILFNSMAIVAVDPCL